ncbi:hypothetical protein BO82DRAFT_41554 [Aspergillus uvarum CBS 121591]|uniref:Uncharacterized protein n=1 Tax=Aspergillus uvarum CBS 121591 TaxID=1448315 RepID=A0A319CWZ4_9EURO|nr:hypothetical protein BO82DRAFT_41554 [Aspergillus uvarum CBS 121591]PYH83463.1 hypothetical protein BO82DRAFT_41554 [Aspergillus uvarum CBS 121591]
MMSNYNLFSTYSLEPSKNEVQWPLLHLFCGAPSRPLDPFWVTNDGSASIRNSDLASRNGAENGAGKARGMEGVVQKQRLWTDSMVVVSCTHVWASKVCTVRKSGIIKLVFVTQENIRVNTCIRYKGGNRSLQCSTKIVQFTRSHARLGERITGSRLWMGGPSPSASAE